MGRKARARRGSPAQTGSFTQRATVERNGRRRGMTLVLPEPPPVEPAPEPNREAATEGSGLDVELAAQASYVTPPIRGGANPFGAGFGGRVGLVYSGFYVGASVV